MDVSQFRKLQIILARLTHLAGYAGALLDRGIQQELTAIALEDMANEGELDMAVADILKQAAADARASAEAGKASSEAVKAAIDSALARLSDNTTLTAEDVAAITTDLEAAKAANDAGVAADTSAAGVADTIDPAVPGGVVAAGDGTVTEG